MPISYHFRDCKALLVTSLTRVSGAIASVQTITFTSALYKNLSARRPQGSSAAPIFLIRVATRLPVNPHFGGLNRHFKPNMRKIQIAISSDLCIRLT